MAKDPKATTAPPTRTGEAGDSLLADFIQVAYTEEMPAIAQFVWDVVIPKGIREKLTDSSIAPFVMKFANVARERGFTKLAGGKYAGTGWNDFSRDLVAAIGHIRKEEAAKKAGGGAKDDDKADAGTPKGGLVGLCVADVAGNFTLHYPNCPDVPPEKEGTKGQQGKKGGQPGTPGTPAVKHRRMTLEQAGKFNPPVPLCDRCRPLIEEEAKKAEPPKAAELFAKYPAKHKAIMEFVTKTYKGDELRRVVQMVGLFLNSEAELDVLVAACTDKATFDAALVFIEESNPAARAAFKLLEGARGLFRGIFGTAQPGQAAPPAGGTGQQPQRPDYSATWKRGVRMFRR